MQGGDYCDIPYTLKLSQISREMIFSLSSLASRRTGRANSRLAGLFSGKISPAKMWKFQCIGYMVAKPGFLSIVPQSDSKQA